MSDFLRFLSQYELLFYLVLGSLVLIFARKTYRAWREWSAALFGLEKEYAQQKFNQGITILAFSGLSLIVIFVINTFVTPSVPTISQLPTATLDLTALPTTPTPVLPPQSTGQGLIPTITSFLSRGCIPGQIDWTDPQNGDAISGKVEIKGTVNIQNLGYYKYEFANVGSEEWTTIAAGNTIVQDAPLGGVWDTSDLIPGEYQLRLIVNDNQNEPLPACIIQIIVNDSE